MTSTDAPPVGLRLEAVGRTVVVAAWDGRIRGAIAVADTVKPGAAAAIAELEAMPGHSGTLTVTIAGRGTIAAGCRGGPVAAISVP